MKNSVLVYLSILIIYLNNFSEYFNIPLSLFFYFYTLLLYNLIYFLILYKINFLYIKNKKDYTWINVEYYNQFEIFEDLEYWTEVRISSKYQDGVLVKVTRLSSRVLSNMKVP